MNILLKVTNSGVWITLIGTVIAGVAMLVYSIYEQKMLRRDENSDEPVICDSCQHREHLQCYDVIVRETYATCGCFCNKLDGVVR